MNTNPTKLYMIYRSIDLIYRSIDRLLRSMHAFPDALKEELPIAPSILGVLLFLEEPVEFLSHIGRASAALVNVVKDVAIRVGGGQSLDRNGKVAAKASFAPAVLALQTRVTNRAILDLASSTDSILFREEASLHLVQ
jgi:hypothetical protein